MFRKMIMAGVRVVCVVLTGTAGVVMGCETSVRDELDCDDFRYQDEAQRILDNDPADPHQLDGTPDDGYACERLPERPPFPSPLRTQ